MSVSHTAYKAASWLAIFKLLSQTFSWVVTIIVARVLIPVDYGLLEMALLITGYAEMFSEIGLGHAIIQKPQIDKKDLSSVFWFSLSLSSIFALSCFPISYLTSHIFNNSDVIPLTQAASLIFILSGLQTIPLSLLKKDLEFKKIGWIELIATVTSSTSMIIIAYYGGGAWALLSSRIIRGIVNVVFLYAFVGWYPTFHFNFTEAKSHLKFGLTISLGRSFFYIYEMSDRFFVGRAWGPQLLGYYSFAMQLSMIPIEKIITIINQVSYPVLAKLQNDQHSFNKFYLDIVKVTATIVIPIYVGGFLVGEDLIKLILDEKWYPIIFIFKYLCLIQIISALNTINSLVHNARGQPERSLFFNFCGFVFMPLSFYFAVQGEGLHFILIPWFTTYIVICAAWIIYTLKTMSLTLNSYIANLAIPFWGTLIMALAIYFSGIVMEKVSLLNRNLLTEFTVKVLIGIIAYIYYLWIYDRELFRNIKQLRAA